jgi:hypothetical protein
MNTHNVNVKTATQDPPKRWVKNLSVFGPFAHDWLGRFNVKYSSHSVRGNFVAHHQAPVFALNKIDAFYIFSRDSVKGGKFDVYGIDILEPVQAVCISTTGYHFTVDAGQWRCLENGEFVEVTSDGDIWSDRTYALPLYGHLTR